MKKSFITSGPGSYFFFTLNSFLASGDFCCLLITFANSLDPDEIRPDNMWGQTDDTLMLFMEEF